MPFTQSPPGSILVRSSTVPSDLDSPSSDAMWRRPSILRLEFTRTSTNRLIPAGVYLPYYLTFDLNWQPMTGDFIELAPGLNVRHAPGHTPGLCILQVNLRESGTWVFTSDMYHVKENYESSIPQGWLMRDFEGWIRSNQMIKALVKRTQANVVLGHDMDYLAKYKNAPDFHS